jgi:hypothetical protein
MIDIVLPLGKGSPFNNMELKYCLRSVEKYLKNYRNIYIIGEKPDWLTNVIHIPFEEKQGDYKEKRIMLKVLAACDLPEVSPEFLFMNDDHFLRATVEADKYPYYYNGNLVDWESKKKMWDPYKQAIQNTLSYLIKNELPARHYDIHTPVLYDKELFKNVMGRYDWDIKAGYVIKSLYCNTLNIAGTPLKDCKISESLHRFGIANLIYNRPVFSIGDGGMNGAMKEWLEEFYPNKSRYEL